MADKTRRTGDLVSDNNIFVDIVNDRVGIGTTVATAQLTVAGDINLTSGIITATSGIVTYYGDGQYLQNIVSGVGIQSGGNVIGTGITTLNFVGAGNTFVLNGNTVDISISGGGFSVTNDTSTNSTYYPVFVDTTSGDPTQTSVSSTKLNFNPSTGNFSATQFTSLSDVTKKTNIIPVENALEITKQLEGVRFDWIDNNKPSIGLIAQQVEEVLPELVETSDDGIKSVSYGNIIGVLVEAIKEQQKLIDKLMEK